MWTTAFGKELVSLDQGDNRTGAKGTDSFFFLTHDDLIDITTNRVVTYGRMVVNYRPQKEDPTRVRLTMGGYIIT